jgi:hypothetical protein
MLSDDLLRGVKAIADYLGPQFTERSLYHLAEKGALPVFRLPGSTTIYARKSELDGHFSATTKSAEQPEAHAA